MTYTKPQLRGYSAVSVIQEVGPNKNQDNPEGDKQSDPAYQADE
jgi:hypothetical protein